MAVRFESTKEDMEAGNGVARFFDFIIFNGGQLENDLR